MLPAITDVPLCDLPAFIAGIGLRPFAAEQLLAWLYRHRAATFGEMTDLPAGARRLLQERYRLSAVERSGVEQAADGTRKLLLRGGDGAPFECVLIPAEERRTTVCLSTQVGCAMGCGFCRTAGMGFVRNLTQGEILGQLIELMRESPDPVTNIVLMGMGEPLANPDAVSDAVELMLDPRAFNLSKRRITLSTSGLVDALEEFVERFDIKVAISLNATTDETRERLMPVNRRYPIGRIMDFCRAYSHRTRHRVTFEYVLIRGVNDTPQDERRLIRLLQGIRAKVNLIPFNPFEGSGMEAPDPETVVRFREALHGSGVQANIRVSRGQEILAACGQLASEAVIRDS